MDPREFLNQINLQSPAVAISIAAIAVLLIVLLNRKRLLAQFREWRVRRCLNRIGSDQIRRLVCADGLDGYYLIDRLALVGNAILLVSYKPYGGNIYCAERISEWTQVIGQKSFKFKNPLFELENQVTALRLLVGNASLQGFLFFSHNAEFPKGHPDSVMTPENIPARFLTANCEAANAEIQAAWDLLKAQQNKTSADSRAGVKT